MTYTIQSKDQIRKLWAQTYNEKGKPDWSHILPYYDENIIFRDSVQTIKGKKEFKAMTERLAERSKDLKMKILNCLKDDKIVMIEWVLILSFGKYPNSKIYGTSRVTLNDEGKIFRQRDYYDLWGDIFDNIPFFRPRYRKFMKKKFG